MQLSVAVPAFKTSKEREIGEANQLRLPILSPDTCQSRRFFEPDESATLRGDWLTVDQDQHEWVVVLKGVARLRFEDKTIEMNAGRTIRSAVP